MPQISPLESFPIVYVLSDPNDTGTYYVRAVVRNSATGSIIQVAGANFVNLTDNTGGRFSKKIQAPADPSGQGLYIDVTVTVYTDSGYTTKSDVYQQENTRYLVAQRWNMALNGGSGAGLLGNGNASGIDYKLIKKIFEEVIAENPATPTDLSPIFRGLMNLAAKIDEQTITINGIDTAPEAKLIIAEIVKEVRANKTQTFDPSKLEEGITAAIKKIDAIEPTKIPEYPNYSPAFNDLKTVLLTILATVTPKPVPIDQTQIENQNQAQRVQRIMSGGEVLVDKKRLEALLP